MQVAYVTSYDAANVKNWSGLGYYIAKTLEHQELNLSYIGSLRNPPELIFQAKQKLYKYLFKKRCLRVAEAAFAKSYAKQVKQALTNLNVDIVFSPGVVPICYLETNKPIVYWTDATFAGLLGFYPGFTNLTGQSVRDGHHMHQEALARCQLAIYSSDWAAQTAVDHYQADPAKLRVVPFGANIERDKSWEEIKTLIDSKPTDQCNLLFLGVNWFRKGGNVALAVAKALNQSGLRTKLTVVGCHPPIAGDLPDFVESLGFVSKSTPEGRKQFDRVVSEAHFLILPSLADCTPVVFCEANALGIPCLTTDVGGIPTLIRPNVNGQLFSKNAHVSAYCEYIEKVFLNYSDYKALALSSFNEYRVRLNWSAAGETVKRLLKTL